MSESKLFVSAIKLSNNPVWRRLVQLGTRRGIKILAKDFSDTPLKDCVWGLYFSTKGICTIVIDSSLPEEERQFALAHELIHYVRHKGSGPKFDSSCEREADSFAARLLWWVKRGLSGKAD